MSVTSIAVCIPAYEEADYLPGLLNSLTKQTVKPNEVVIADSSNSYGHYLAETIASNYGVRIIRTISGNLSKARNDAAHNTRSSVLIFVDADSVLSSDYIESVLDVRTGKIKQGRVRYFDASPVNESLYALVDTFRTQPSSSGMTVTRETFNVISGWDESFIFGIPGEDIDFANRVKVMYGKCYVRAKSTVYLSARRISMVGVSGYLFGSPWDKETRNIRNGVIVQSRRHI